MNVDSKSPRKVLLQLTNGRPDELAEDIETITRLNTFMQTEYRHGRITHKSSIKAIKRLLDLIDNPPPPSAPQS